MKREKPKLGLPLFRDGTISVDNAESRTATFIASNEEPDRYGDIIRTEGWDLDNFLKNPVLLFGHKSRELPIGRVTKVAKDTLERRLIAEVEFVSKDISEFADSVYKMVKAGFLNAVSVGFLPTKMPNDIKDPVSNQWTGYEFVGQELLELSVVPVPAVPGAIAIARSLSVDKEHVMRAMPDVLPLPVVERGASAFHAARQRELDLLRLKTFA